MGERSYHLNLNNLVEEAKKDENVVTVEATVVTGFEGTAKEECLEKCRPRLISRAQGRIFFNVEIEKFDKVLSLRSVDNLLLVNHFQKVDLSKVKEEALEQIGSLVDQIEWDSSLKIWAKLKKFDGILFPGSPDTGLGNQEVPSREDEDNKNTTSELSEVVQENSVVPEIPKLSVLIRESLNINEKIENKNGNRTKKISESSDDMYFSADETCEDLVEGKCLLINNNTKEKVDEHVELLSQNEEPVELLSQKEEPIELLPQKEKPGKPAGKKPVDPNILKFRASCDRAGNHSFSSMEAAARFGGTLNDKFHWTVDLTNYDLNAILNINKGECYCSLAITDKSMHRRNITHFGYVTLRSTICYNLVRLAEPARGEIILDPLCGGGSIPIEGSLGFPSTFHIGGDNNEKAMNRTLANISHIKKSEQNLFVDAVTWSAKKLPLKDSCIDVCVTDLPFGKRSGKKVDNLPLYTQVLSEMARVTRCGISRAVLLTHDKKSLTKALQGSNGNYWRQMRTVTVNQGGLFSTVYVLLRTARPFLH